MMLLRVLVVLFICHYILGAATLGSLRDEDIDVDTGYASVSDKVLIQNTTSTKTIGLFAFNLTSLPTTNFKKAYYRFTQTSTYSCEVGASCTATLVLVPYYTSWYEGEWYGNRTDLVTAVDLNDTDSYAQTTLSSQGSSLVVDVTKQLNQIIQRNNGVIPEEASFSAFIVSGRGTFTVPSRRSRPGETFIFVDTTATASPTTTSTTSSAPVTTSAPSTTTTSTTTTTVAPSSATTTTVAASTTASPSASNTPVTTTTAAATTTTSTAAPTAGTTTSTAAPTTATSTTLLPTSSTQSSDTTSSAPETTVSASQDVKSSSSVLMFNSALLFIICIISLF